MALRLAITDRDFAARFAALASQRRDADPDIGVAVAAIVNDVRHRGDAALIDYSQRFDRVAITGRIRIDRAEIAAARGQCGKAELAALELAAARIGAFHQAQLPQDRDILDPDGVRMGWRWSAVEAAGLYVPGGTASYPSSVLMNAISAKVAGVNRLVMTVPTPDDALNPLVLAAAEIAGVDEVYRVGGAQAIAALAYGTQTIAPVDKIVGPGNAYVAEAKRQVFGVVGIDMVAGPSEILVVADAANDPAFIAADLLAQAEHDRLAQSILITDDAGFAASVEEMVARQLQSLSRADIAGASWRDHGVVILVERLDQAPALIDALAPEHLSLAVADPEALFAAVHHAGSVFLGRLTPEAIGDYVGGPNHVLPTGRRARFSSGLGVGDFMKRTTYLGCSAPGLANIGPAAVTLAEAEGLTAHALSVALRLRD